MNYAQAKNAFANFNSIKVQLELLRMLLGFLRRLLFQFHKGTIRTYLSAGASLFSQLFQFHKGTIRTQILSFIYLLAKSISIP